MRVKINLKSVWIYLLYFLALVLFNCIAAGAPFGLGPAFSMLILGGNLVAAPILYVLSTAVAADLTVSLIALAEAGFLTLVTLLYRRYGRKIKYEAALYLALALTPFIILSPFKNVAALAFLKNAYAVRGVTAAAVMIAAYFIFRSLYSLLFRLYRCRLRPDEIVCLAVAFICMGVGLINLVGRYAYICMLAPAAAFFVRLYKSPAALAAAPVLAAPPAIVLLNFNHLTAFLLIAIAALVFSFCGRFFICAVTAVSTCGYLYLSGMFCSPWIAPALYMLLLLAACTAITIVSDERLAGAYRLITLEKIAPRESERRLKEYTSEKLFKMSEVFREIEAAFNAIDDGPDEAAMRRRMLQELKESMCTDCKKAEICKKTAVYRGFASLVDSGCLKGKVSFVDLTGDVTANCQSPTAAVENVNRLLYEYRKSKLEAENAKSGRKLLAGQARGVAEVLKSRAVELCREETDNTQINKKVVHTLLSRGISCPEADVRGDINAEICVTVVGNVDVARLKRAVEEAMGGRLMLKDKKRYDQSKCAYTFVRPPKYDAAFGVAYKVKDGESVSGDTHTVIKINEHSFLMALSDGMGSGEYARRVSATAISLIEAFYRSEMPQGLILDTINKLLCFNRDERFACIDAAAIDLNDLSASFIKIGSPAGIIVRRGEIKVLESSSLPLGILDNLHPATATEQLKKDDIVVFMSDGVTSAFDGTANLYEYLSTLKPLNPQSLADGVLAAALAKSSGTPDDMTVLCVRIFEADT